MVTSKLAFKLVRQRKNGTFGPLFIDKKLIFSFNVWLRAKSKFTKGFKLRPGWHVVANPHAPHLSKKGRVWLLVEIRQFQSHRRSSYQGDLWYIAQEMRILRVWIRS
jgi:hypothetical protein